MWLRSSPANSYTQSFASTVNSQPHTHTHTHEHSVQWKWFDLLFFNLLWYSIQTYIYTEKQTHVLVRKQVEVTWHSIKICMRCMFWVCVRVFDVRLISTELTPSTNQKVCPSLFLFWRLYVSFLLIRKRCRNDFKYFPKDRNNNHHSLFTSSFKQKFCLLPLNKSKMKEALSNNKS